jgi:ABC-type amino acid transport substrate-binding protein
VVRGDTRAVSIGAIAAACLALTVAILSLTGCGSPQAATTVKPKLAPPAIKQAGVLRAGVDLSYPPFAGTDRGKRAGIDVDVASALAGRLGLRVQFVDVKASQVATALAHGDADIVLSAPFSADVVTRASIAGTYLSDGPALFARDTSETATATASILADDDARIGAQQGSEAYWQVLGDLGPEHVSAYPSLREALEGLGRGDVSAVAGDALVGAYIVRDLSGVRYVGTIAPAHLLGVAVAEDNAKLNDAIRNQLDDLAADGALSAIRTAWVGRLPKLPLPSAGTTADAGADAGADGDVGTGADTGTDADADTGTDAGTDADAGAGADIGADAGSDGADPGWRQLDAP